MTSKLTFLPSGVFARAHFSGARFQDRGSPRPASLWPTMMREDIVNQWDLFKLETHRVKSIRCLSHTHLDELEAVSCMYCSTRTLLLNVRRAMQTDSVSVFVCAVQV